MRFLIFAALPVAALLAQAPPPAEQTQPRTEPPPTQVGKPKKLDPAAKAAAEERLRKLLEQGHGQLALPPPTQAGKPMKLDDATRAMAKLKLQLADTWQRPVNVTTGTQVTVLRPGQPCAVPLTNTLRAPAQPPPDPLPVTPGSPGAVPLQEVSKPAPSCDDVKR